MKKTIYELLGLIKDGKAPKKIKYINSIWEYDKETKDYTDGDLWLIYSMNSIGLTEREVEILEEEKKIPEKINISNFPRHNNSLKKTAIKVNEIINYLDFLKSKGDE